MSKRVEEFVKRANEMDELAKVKMDAICKLKDEVDEITDRRANQCEEFFNNCTEDEFNELLVKADNRNKLMYLRMKIVKDLFDKFDKEKEDEE